DIAKAGKETAAIAKTDEAKRALLRNLLMPMARTTEQVERLDKELPNLDRLDDRIAEAAQRRMLLDILTPLEIHRGSKLRQLPAHAGKTLQPEDLDNARMLDYIVDSDLVPLKRLQDVLQQRIDAALATKYDPAVHFGDNWKELPRDVVDKRKAIAFLLTTISQ